MKFKQLLLLTLFPAFIACNNSGTSSTSTDEKMQATEQENEMDNNKSYYKLMEGNIGEFPAVMTLLYEDDANYSGEYYYVSQGIPILLEMSGDDKKEEHKLFLSTNPYDEKVSPEEFVGTLKGNEFSGEWKSGNKTLPFRFVEKYNKGSYPFAYALSSDSVKYIRHGKDTRGFATSEVSVCFPKKDHPAYDFIIDQLSQLLNLKTPASSAPALAKAGSFEFLKFYKSELDSGYTDEEVLDTMMMHFIQYQFMSELYPKYNQHNILVLSSSYYAYTGGAHGNHGTEFCVIDVEGKRLLKLNDVVTDSLALQPFIEAAFRKKYGLKANQPLKELLFENYLMANDNFYIAEKGIGFNYQPYEVAPYVVGSIDLIIPAKDIIQYIQPAIKARMGW